jgi:hypothetical protein
MCIMTTPSIGVSKDEVVVHLAMLGTACWAWVVEVEMLPELETFLAMFRQFEFWELVTAVGSDLVWLLTNTVGLVTASVVTAILVAAEELVEGVVLVGEVAVELVCSPASLKISCSFIVLQSFLFTFSSGKGSVRMGNEVMCLRVP